MRRVGVSQREGTGREGTKRIKREPREGMAEMAQLYRNEKLWEQESMSWRTFG